MDEKTRRRLAMEDADAESLEALEAGAEILLLIPLRAARLGVGELTDGQRVEYRLGRAGTEGAEYGPWKTGALCVQTRKDGTVCLVSVSGELSWAEYAPEDYSVAHDEWLVEDYYMQLRRSS